ncbi:uncharacterized protein CDAR_568501 [Caerostris darwini]|uniref:Uncharacterized protein n=1 Tax=Caerostris darwini TaxID=1538125 RepID=A0AAV4VZC9_9ARAC|nr:uncharacterized protein CDAR_568501 [Caerostris darwini]
MILFFRYTIALACATALSLGLLLKPIIPMKPKRRAALASNLRKLMEEFEELDPPISCQPMNALLKQLLKWLEKTNEYEKQPKCQAFRHVVQNNNYLSRDFLRAMHNFITGHPF